ncbi:sensor histidine kinase [Paratissierella segnis]|uniref:histidine kinase n=1 Tax=Paratissierella segnis TaxID=2763679 RepID=A0A926EUB2_9FIRM|nr:cell wall metabolism sensor histidine kinase WalK [Paratissierella segnis]MBC8586732.1 HAMP domain-containing protein [Paratissierella segnis]
MFSSIKWRFIVIYFLLVFIAMVIIGIFIVDKLEQHQINSVITSMEYKLENIASYSTYLTSDDWVANREEIQDTITEYASSAETLYVILNEDIPTIIASSSKQNDRIIGDSAFQQRFIDPTLVLKAFEGETAVNKEVIDNIPLEHVAYPVFSSNGKVKGILYMTSDLKNVYATVNESKTILTNATFLALGITVLLGFMIASSITEPIHDVTKKAEEMAMGNFDQFVEVKSDDEIGQLANMFNHLTLKLNQTIQDMDLEKSKLDTIFNYMAEGVVAIDRNGSIIHANPIAIELLNLGNNFNEKVFNLSDINLGNINYNITNSLEGDVITEINSQVFKVKYAPFKNEKNDIGGLIIVFQDITREHRLDNMRKEFVANVSHELKTPITTIKSYTETLMEDDIDKNTKDRFLTVIDSECDRMTRLVRDLLQLSNLDYKKTNWKKVEISTGEIIRDIISKLDLLIKEKGHRLILNIEEDIPNVVVDKDGIEQVILNIISNSIKYTEDNGIIEINNYEAEGDVVISIKDNGIGIPQMDQKRIFERFYRVEKGRSRDLGGTGLGLSIAKEIIEAHNGNIVLNSEPNIGTEVIIKLPTSVIQS